MSFFRDGHECQHCHGKSKDPILNVHHIESRKTGGDSPENLITLCQSCHHEFHSLSLEEQKKWNLKRQKKYSDAAFMGMMRWAFYNRLKDLYSNVRMTFGYITKNNRIKYGLAKEHDNDAYCIAGNFKARPMEKVLFRRKVRRHNRQIHKFSFSKGHIRKRHQTPYLVKSFRLFDKVLDQGQICFINGRTATGSFSLRTFDRKKVSDGVTYKKLKLIEERKGYIQDWRERQFLAHL